MSTILATRYGLLAYYIVVAVDRDQDGGTRVAAIELEQLRGLLSCRRLAARQDEGGPNPRRRQPSNGRR